jgi:GDPmannose 4,6-dehydratase
MKTALITGITGQDGFYLTKLLLDKGYKVYGTLRDTTFSAMVNLKFLGVKDRVELIRTNLLNPSSVKELIDMARPDEIYNLAAQSSVAISFEQPIQTVEFNVLSTINLLEALRLLRVGTRFYQASSSEMYGRIENLPVTEGTVFHPVSPYAISKATGHWLAANYREAYGLFCCSGILFNHESVLRPAHFATKKTIATAVRVSKGSKENLKLGNIEIKRDWGYAPKYVEAMWLMLQQDYAEDYIIATNEPHSLKEFVELVFACLGLDWEEHVILDQGLYRPSDIDVIYGNPEKAKRKLGWDYGLGFEELIKVLVQDELRYQENIIVLNSFHSDTDKSTCAAEL